MKYILILIFIISCGVKQDVVKNTYKSNLVSVSSGALENCSNCLIIQEIENSSSLNILIQNLEEINYTFCEDEYVFYKEFKETIFKEGTMSYSLDNNDKKGCLGSKVLITIEKSSDEIYFIIDFLKFKLEKVD